MQSDAYFSTSSYIYIDKFLIYIYIYIISGYMYMLYYRYHGIRNIYQKIYKLRKDVIVRGEFASMAPFPKYVYLLVYISNTMISVV